MTTHLLRTFIRGLLLEDLRDADTHAHAELTEVQMGNIRDEMSKSKVFGRLGLRVDDFASLSENADDWMRIFSFGHTEPRHRIRYLGSGRQGTAFSLGNDMILKLEPGAPRASEIEAALFSGGDIGAGLPNVLNTGVFRSNIGDIGWSIVEKVQSADEIGKDSDWKELWKSISDGIETIVKNEQRSSKASGVPPIKFGQRDPDQLAADLLPLLPQDKLMSVEERYLLLPDWFPKFVKGILNHYRLGMVDFKPDNMGVRNGYVIFFDAASALRRDIKKWEPKSSAKT